MEKKNERFVEKVVKPVLIGFAIGGTIGMVIVQHRIGKQTLKFMELTVENDRLVSETIKEVDKVLENHAGNFDVIVDALKGLAKHQGITVEEAIKLAQAK